jgi:signal transduction histidine kinase
MQGRPAPVTDGPRALPVADDAPFRRDGLLARAAPFAVIAVLAEASLALPPGAQSQLALAVSIALLLAVPVLMLLPWPRLPGWATVLVPLTYTGSVLALSLAAGPNSGVGLVILIPLVWTTLFHRRWESAVVVVAIVIVEWVTSVAQDAPAGVTLRRVLLFALVGAVIAVASHGLRDRMQRSISQTAELEARLREMTVARDRDRIAGNIQDQVVGRLFAAGLALQGAAAQAERPETKSRIAGSVAEIDEATRLLRHAIFGLTSRPSPVGLRQRMLEMSAAVEPPAEVSFSGDVDGALPAGEQEGLIAALREALTLLGPDGSVQAIDLAAGDVLTVTITWLPSSPAALDRLDIEALQRTAARSGSGVEVHGMAGAATLCWQFSAR